MPNYCDNELWIRGDITFRRDFIDFARSNDRVLDFNQFVPYPAEWAEKDRIWDEWWRNGHEGQEPEYAYSKFGYEWSISFWGTKWNSLESRVDSNSRRTLYCFDTAWSPPTPVILAMSQKFPNLNFKLKYWEQGCAFKGICECENGVVLRDESSNYRGYRGG